MADIQESIMIGCPVEKAFAYTTEVKSWPDWQTFIRKSEQTSQGPWSVGATSRGVVHLMGLSMKWTASVTENEPNTKWTKNINSRGMNITERAVYDPAKEGVKFTIMYDVKAGGFMKLFSPMIVSSMRKETVKSLANLKSVLERQA